MLRQDELFDDDLRAPSGVVTVNDRVSFRTDGTHRVVSVHGVVAAHYDLSDRAAEAYAMVTLVESGYADQKEVARAFGCSSRSVRRYQERLAGGGLRALGRLRGRPSVGAPSRPSRRDRTILRLKARGLSNRAIAQRLGVVEHTIRKRLRRLHWSAVAVAAPSLLDEADAPPTIATRAELPTPEPRPIVDGPVPPRGPCRCETPLER